MKMKKEDNVSDEEIMEDFGLGMDKVSHHQSHLRLEKVDEEEVMYRQSMSIRNKNKNEKKKE